MLKNPSPAITKETALTVRCGITFSRDLRLISHRFASQTKALVILEGKAHPVPHYQAPKIKTQLYPDIPMYCLLVNGWCFFGKWSLSLSLSQECRSEIKKVSALLLFFIRARARTQQWPKNTMIYLRIPTTKTQAAIIYRITGNITR